MSETPADRCRAAKASIAEHRDRDTPAWGRLMTLLRARLEQLREENDFGDAEATVRRRGRIAEVKTLLDLGNEDPHREQKQLDGRGPSGNHHLEIDA